MQFLLSRMIGAIQKYAKATIAVVVILSIGFAFAAIKIQFDADYSSLLPPIEDNFIMPEEAAKDTVFSTDHIVMVESDNL